MDLADFEIALVIAWVHVKRLLKQLLGFFFLSELQLCMSQHLNIEAIDEVL